MINNRQNGRRRGRGGTPRPNGGGNGPDRGNRIDNRARGNATQLHEKYKTLARDAQMQGDRVMTEYYLQFADHYFRVLSENRPRFDEQQRRDRFEDGEYDEEGGEANGQIAGDEDRGEQPRDYREQRPRRDDRPDREPRQARDDRDDRNDRQPREDRPYREERQAQDRPAQERQPREDRPARDDRPRDDRQPRFERQPRTDRPARADRQPADGGGYDDANGAPRQDRRPRQPELPDLAAAEPAAPFAPEAAAAEGAEPVRRTRGRPRRVVVDDAPAERIELDRLPPALSEAASADAPAEEEKPKRRTRRPRAEGAAADA